MNAFRKIAVASDFGDASARAVDRALDLGRSCGAEVVIVHAVEPIVAAYPIALVPDPAVLDEAAKTELEAEAARAGASAPAVSTALLHGRAVDAITKFVEDNHVDLLVVGTHGRKGPSRWILGSVAEKLLRSSRVPVLSVPVGHDGR